MSTSSRNRRIRAGRRDPRVTAHVVQQDQRPQRIATALTAAALAQARLEAAAERDTEHGEARDE